MGGSSSCCVSSRPTWRTQKHKVNSLEITRQPHIGAHKSAAQSELLLYRTKGVFPLTKRNIQVDSVGVQIHANNICWGVIKVKVAGVHAHYEWARGIEDACERERAQGDVGTLPLEGENHLQGDKTETGILIPDKRF